MSKIGIAEVNRIAALARIGLTPDEAALMAEEIGRIIDFVEQLSAVDIEGLPPTDQVTGLEDVWREDVVTPSLSRDILLAGAPVAKDGYIVVKRVLNG
jgi:aspartyl-tRNA(Asn)/glutamyl-tRNA(Gln) amidotransferase subunit C